MHWSSMELLESNNLLAGWSEFKLRSTPLQSKKITDCFSKQDKHQENSPEWALPLLREGEI